MIWRAALAAIIAVFLCAVGSQPRAQFNGCSAGFCGGVATGGGGGRTCTDDTASTNFLGRTSGLSNALQDDYCNMIKGLESDGLITGTLGSTASCGSTTSASLIDLFYIFSTNTTTTANLNLCGTSFGLTQHGTITFTA